MERQSSAGLLPMMLSSLATVADGRFAAAPAAPGPAARRAQGWPRAYCGATSDHVPGTSWVVSITPL